jgi:hypothetical protein
MQLDQNACAEILERLHKAFPRLQIIVTGNRDELLEHGLHYQCLKLDQHGIYPIQLEASQQQLSALYQDLVQPEPESETQPPPLLPSEPTLTKMDALFHQIQALNPQEKSDLLNLLKIDDTPQQSPL